MNFVINLSDGGDKEFFLASKNRFIPLSDTDTEGPLILKIAKAVTKKLDELRPKYACMCNLYCVDLRDFDVRRQLVQQEEAARRKPFVSGETGVG